MAFVISKKYGQDRTLYIVSGFMRTGTSMMMKALEAGGLEAEYKQSRETMRQRFADDKYDPNVGGLYELEREDYMKPGFPKGYEGKLIKALNMEHKQPNGVGKSMNIMPDGIRVVYMKRDAEEIRQSFDAFFDKQLPEEQIKTMNERFKRCLERIRNRRDVITCHDFWFREVIEDPKKHFQILKEAGWRIDVDKCVEVVEPKYCRFKKENLTKGVI